MTTPLAPLTSEYATRREQRPPRSRRAPAIITTAIAVTAVIAAGVVTGITAEQPVPQPTVAETANVELQRLETLDDVVASEERRDAAHAWAHGAPQRQAERDAQRAADEAAAADAAAPELSDPQPGDGVGGFDAAARFDRIALELGLTPVYVPGEFGAFVYPGEGWVVYRGDGGYGSDEWTVRGLLWHELFHAIEGDAAAAGFDLGTNTEGAADAFMELCGPGGPVTYHYGSADIELMHHVLALAGRGC